MFHDILKAILFLKVNALLLYYLTLVIFLQKHQHNKWYVG